MPVPFFCNVGNLKKFSKVLVRRFGMPLSQAQEHLARAGGYESWHRLQAALAKEENCCIDGIEQVSFSAWRSSLNETLGADLEVLMTPAELETWWERLCAMRLPARLQDEAASALKAIEATVPDGVRTLLSGLPVGSRLQFYRQPKASLGGLTPLAALQAGHVAAVRRAAEGFRDR